MKKLGDRRKKNKDRKRERHGDTAGQRNLFSFVRSCKRL